MPVNSVMGGFPSLLFSTLTGVTLLFTMAQVNLCIARLCSPTTRSRAPGATRGVVPITFFVLAAALASMGPGNIATAALVAPMAMTTAAAGGHPRYF